MGSFIGAVEVGLSRAMARDAAAAREGMAGFMMSVVTDSAKSLIPFDVKLPGIGSIKNKAIDELASEIATWGKQDDSNLPEMVDSLQAIARQIPGVYHVRHGFDAFGFQ